MRCSPNSANARTASRACSTISETGGVTVRRMWPLPRNGASLPGSFDRGHQYARRPVDRRTGAVWAYADAIDVDLAKRRRHDLEFSVADRIAYSGALYPLELTHMRPTAVRLHFEQARNSIRRGEQQDFRRAVAIEI